MLKLKVPPAIAGWIGYDVNTGIENCMGEPDLLVLFSSNITLKGYPPWQLRLTEI